MSVRNKGGVNVGEGSDYDCMLLKICVKFDNLRLYKVYLNFRYLLNLLRLKCSNMLYI